MRWLLLPLLLASALEAAETPRIEDGPGSRLVLTGLPPVLADEAVREHLTSGLTTTFQFRLTGAGKIPAGARVEIRYDLWDEVFLVTAGGIDGQVERHRAPSFEALVDLWGALRLTLVDRSRLSQPLPARVRVVVDVVPFSQAEQDDTQRWFSESLDQARRSGTAEVGRAGEDRSETLSQTFTLLLSTSIQRRAVVSYPWTVKVPPTPRRGATGGPS
ncbi:MAG: hypothetical protein AAF657_20650 [Acidobacteriota bacterium]